MNTTTRALIYCAPLAAALALNVRAEGREFENDKDKTSYAVGVSTATMLKVQQLPIDPEWVALGLRDSLAETNIRLSDDEIRTLVMKLRQDTAVKRREELLSKLRRNKAEGEAFLATNKNNPGIVTLPNGLQYRVLKEGSGDPPKREEIVKMHYRSMMLNGREFDNSNKLGGQPAVHPVNGVIAGWTEALVRMKPGAKWELFVPPSMAYHDYGDGQQVGPEQTLHYELELISVVKPLQAVKPMASDVIMVPSFEEMQKGAQVKTIKAEEVEKLEEQHRELLKKEAAQKKAKEKKQP